jgi:hypothetical protein
MLQANLGGMELLRGVHKKCKSEYIWLVQTGNQLDGAESKRIYLTDCMYRSYPIRDTQHVKERIAPYPLGGFARSN